MTEPQARWRQVLANLLMRYRYALMIIGIVLIAISFGPSRQLKLDQTIESLYDPQDPHLLDYVESKSLFGGDEFVIVAYRDPELMKPEGLAHVRALSDRVSNIPGVKKESTQNLADAIAPLHMSFLERILLALRNREMRQLIEGIMLGSDQETTGIVLRLISEDKATVPRGETIDQIRTIALETRQEQTGDSNTQVYVAGEPVQVHDMFRIVEEDGQTLFIWSLILLAGVILVFFRNLRWVVLPLSVIGASIIWTRAVLVYSGMQLSMVSSMLNSLVTVCGIAEVMHITVYFREHRKDFDRIGAMRQTLIVMMPVTFWTVVTTAAGFISLPMVFQLPKTSWLPEVNQIAPVSSFGTMMSIGSMMVIVAIGLLVPGGGVVGRVHVDPADAPAEHKLVGVLGYITEWVEKRSLFVGGFAALLTAFMAIGFLHLEVETDFSRNFRESSEIVKSLNFVETQLGGAGTWEVNFPAPKELTPEFLDRVRSTATRLRDMEQNGQPRLTKVLAITDVIDLAPGATDTVDRIRNKLNRIAEFQPEYEPGLYQPEHERMRFVLRARERQPAEVKLALIDDVRNTVAEEFGTAKTTGMFVLLAYMIKSLLTAQFLSFVLTTLMMWGMMALAFRSWRVGLVSLAPNIFPIVVLIGGMGWLRLPINIGTAMIASVSMGLTIDSSIHYVVGYRRARLEHGDDALRRTHEDVGRALVFATFALMVGFSVLTLSNFIPLVYFGVLVSAAMFGGLIGNLTFFPLLLRWADRDRKKPTSKVAAKTIEPAIVDSVGESSSPPTMNGDSS